MNSLQDTLDAVRGEFLRIRGLSYKISMGQSALMEEICDICDRATTEIEDAVPVIQQRDKLEFKVAILENRIAKALGCIADGEARFNYGTSRLSIKGDDEDVQMAFFLASEKFKQAAQELQ